MLFIVVSAFVLLSVAFVQFMVKKDRGHKEPVGALWGAFAFGILGVGLAVGMEMLAIPNNILSNPTAFPPGQVAFFAMMIGIIEEACKFLPLALFIYGKKYFDEHTDGVLYFAIAGLGFGLPENILYSLQFGASTGIKRLVLTLLFHSATTAIAGYWLARYKLDRISPWAVVTALVGAMFLHGLYDYGLLSGKEGLALLSLGITFGLTTYLFVLLKKSIKADVAVGLSSEGNNTFCRVCGAPNPEHNLYCSHCGNRA